MPLVVAYRLGVYGTLVAILFAGPIAKGATSWEEFLSGKPVTITGYGIPADEIRLSKINRYTITLKLGSTDRTIQVSRRSLEAFFQRAQTGQPVAVKGPGHSGAQLATSEGLRVVRPIGSTGAQLAFTARSLDGWTLIVSLSELADRVSE